MQDSRGARNPDDFSVPNGVLEDGGQQQQRYTAGTAKLEEDEEDQGSGGSGSRIDVEDLDMALARQLEGDNGNGQDRFDYPLEQGGHHDDTATIASTSKSTAAIDPSLSSAPAGPKKKTATKNRRKRNMDDADDSRGRRKKVSKACIYCKRSHMTCTENRPCDRCIKRDIAHLCSDTPVGESGPPRAASARASSSSVVAPPHASTSQAPEEPSAKRQRTSEMASPLSFKQPSQSPTGSNQISLPHQQPQHHPTYDSQQSTRHQSGPSPEDTFNPTNLPFQDVPNEQNEQPQVSLNNSNSAQQSSNPFALLNQVYDYSYPSNNSSSTNTLANLRLFASTADAQFGGLGQSANGFDLSSLGLLHPNGGQGSDSGAGSDIDSNALDEFLRSLDEIYLNPMPDVPQKPPTPLQMSTSANEPASYPNRASPVRADSLSQAVSMANSKPSPSGQPARGPPSRSLSPVLGASGAGGQTSTEKFLLTAADQKEGTRDERLNKVIRAKWEAGLLKPFNYIKGYERLHGWMEKKWQTSSKLRTLKILSEFRPAFRAVAQGLTDLDLIFIEEAFERLLLDCDRLFSTMGIPACLWRRTGEIFKGNREFAELVGVPYEQLRDGKLAIYEFMTEDSAVNFWEKYGSIAFDPGQKAVLTSCVLINQSKLRELSDEGRGLGTSAGRINTTSGNTTPGGVNLSRDSTIIPPSTMTSANVPLDAIPREALIYCTFSFTIRRDAYHIPNAIVGNYMPYTPKSMKQQAANTS